MRWRRTALLSTFLIVTSGCPGGIDTTRRDSHTPLPDQAARDLSSDGAVDLAPADQAVAQDKGPACKPDDAMTSCDPVTPSGCPAGAGCYLVQGKYVDCICPAGTKAAGAVCTTTVQCQPGYGCAGSAPPGACRRICSLTSPVCPSGTTCKPIPTALQYGLCQ